MKRKNHGFEDNKKKTPTLDHIKMNKTHINITHAYTWSGREYSESSAHHTHKNENIKNSNFV